MVNCGTPTLICKDAKVPLSLMARSAAQGDKEVQEWLDANCPQKPEWLQKLIEGNAA